MRRRNNRNKTIWIIFGIVVLAAVAIGVSGKIFGEKSPASVAQGAAATSTPVVASTTIGTMSLRGDTVSARGRTYTLTSADNLTAPGSFAVEGTITRVIADPTTVSQTPYYFVVQDQGSPVLIGVVVPVADKAAFQANAFPVGSDILAAGIVFPAANPATVVFDYSEMLKELHVAPGLRGLNLATDTPYLGVNFKNLAVMG